jgi:hypothetical protein
MEKNIMRKLLCVLVLLLAISAILLVGCNRQASGELKLESVDSQSMMINYSFDNCHVGGLFLDGELRFNTESSTSKGTYKIVGLEPNTNYIFQLIDMGDPGQPVLDTLSIRTLTE